VLQEFVKEGITVAGLPVIVSDQVDANTRFWASGQAHVVLVVRKGTKVERFPNVQKDGIWASPLSRQ